MFSRAFLRTSYVAPVKFYHSGPFYPLSQQTKIPLGQFLPQSFNGLKNTEKMTRAEILKLESQKPSSELSRFNPSATTVKDEKSLIEAAKRTNDLKGIIKTHGY